MIHTNDSLLSKMTKEDLIITVWLKSYELMSIRILNWIKTVARAYSLSDTCGSLKVSLNRNLIYQIPEIVPSARLAGLIDKTHSIDAMGRYARVGQ